MQKLAREMLRKFELKIPSYEGRRDHEWLNNNLIFTPIRLSQNTFLTY